MDSAIPNSFYRVSMKALILDDSRERFLITLEESGMWELPGGGLDWGEDVESCIRREIREEMGLTVTEVAARPSYYLVGKNMKGHWLLNLIFETKVQDLNFTPSDECKEIKFVSAEELGSINAFRTIRELAAQFDPVNHRT